MTMQIPWIQLLTFQKVFWQQQIWSFKSTIFITEVRVLQSLSENNRLKKMKTIYWRYCYSFELVVCIWIWGIFFLPGECCFVCFFTNEGIFFVKQHVLLHKLWFLHLIFDFFTTVNCNVIYDKYNLMT